MNNGPDNEVNIILSHIVTEVNWFQETFQITEELFIKNDNLTIFNFVAPDFFGFLQKLLIHEMILVASRLSDEDKVARNENASCIKLSNIMKNLSSNKSNNEFISRIDTVISNIKENAAVLRIYRNKILAHSDSEVVKGAILQNLKFSDFKSFLDSALDFIDMASISIQGKGLSKEIMGPYSISELLKMVKCAERLKMENSRDYHLLLRQNDSL
jgi:hypothetical protein